MSKLDETAKTEAALNILAMNVAHRLHRWLLRFFAFRRFALVFQQALFMSWSVYVLYLEAAVGVLICTISEGYAW